MTESGVLRRRAMTHASLGETARLAIVDALWNGDASPSRLQASLGMSSNLLAHHLKVLEDAGVLTRRRSEGDRRRTYLKLVRSSFEGLLPGVADPLAHRVRVVFVCTANSARSQLASALWRRCSATPTTSAGTRPADHIAEGAVSVARRHGLDLRGLHPQSVDDVVAGDDFVITVCDSAHEELSNPDVLHWSIPDPVRVGTDAAFETAFEQISRRVLDLAQGADTPK